MPCAARPPTRYAVEAAIAAVHAEAPTWPDTDWAEIVALYDVLLRLLALAGRRAQPGGRGRACATARRPASTRCARCWTSRRWRRTATSAPPAPTSCASCTSGRQAAEAYEEALALTDNDVERAFLSEQLGAVENHLPS